MISQSQMLQMFLCKHAHQNIIFTIIIIITLLGLFHLQCNLHISGQNWTKTSGRTIGQSYQSTTGKSGLPGIPYTTKSKRRQGGYWHHLQAGDFFSKDQWFRGVLESASKRRTHTVLQFQAKMFSADLEKRYTFSLSLLLAYLKAVGISCFAACFSGSRHPHLLPSFAIAMLSTPLSLLPSSGLLLKKPQTSSGTHCC